MTIPTYKFTLNGYPMDRAPEALKPYLEGMDGAVAVYGFTDSDGMFCSVWHLQRGGEVVGQAMIREPMMLPSVLTYAEKLNVNRLYGKLARRPLIDSSRWTGRPVDAGSLADVLYHGLIRFLDWALSFDEDPIVWVRSNRGSEPDFDVQHYYPEVIRNWADNGSDPLAHARRLINDEGTMKAAYERHYFGNLALGVAIGDPQ